MLSHVDRGPGRHRPRHIERTSPAGRATGQSGNLHARNNQIRSYCQTNNKILFDFADIERYDPDGIHYPDGTDWCEWCETWCTSHSCPALDCVDDEDCQHSVCFNCYQKGKAFWWMMARIAGWTPNTSTARSKY